MDKTVRDSERAGDLQPTEPSRREDGAANLSPSLREALLRLAYRFLWDRHEAEDVVQDALAVAHERRKDLRHDDKLWSWICRVVVQRCHLRGREKLRWKQHREPYLNEVTRTRGQTTPAEETDLKRSVQQALSRLPQRQREVIVLRHLQGMGYDQIGRVLEISPSTARVHARAGREALRKLVVEADPEAFRVPQALEGDEP